MKKIKKLHYWLYARDRNRNDGWFLACRMHWEYFDPKYTRIKSKVTCSKCLKSIKNKHYA